jgi:hypothetical protein
MFSINARHWIYLGRPTSTPSNLFLIVVDLAKESVRKSFTMNNCFSKHLLVHDKWRHLYSSNQIPIFCTSTLNFCLRVHSYPNHWKKQKVLQVVNFLIDFVFCFYKQIFLWRFVSFGSSSRSLSCTICACKIVVSQGSICLYHLSNGLFTHLTDMHPYDNQPTTILIV